MRLLLNGEPREFPEDVRNVADLLESLNLAGKFVAVEVNRELIPRARYAEHFLQDGDQVEAVTFVGGG